MTSPVRVLVIDDDEFLLELLERGLTRDGFEVRVGTTVEAVGPIGAEFQPEVILLDVNLSSVPDLDGLRRARDAAPVGSKIFLLSAADESTLRRIARDLGADGWLSKSTPVAEVGKKIRAIG